MSAITTPLVWEHVQPAAARRLLTGAIDAFAERGFQATTTRDIASRAGMSPAALYVHYSSKERLLFEISLYGHRAALEILRQANAEAETRDAGGEAPVGSSAGARDAGGDAPVGSGAGARGAGGDAAGGSGAAGSARLAVTGGSSRTPADRLRAMVSAFTAWHAEHHTIARVVQYELAALSPEHFAEVATIRRAISDLVEQVLSDGVADGSFAVKDLPGTTLAVLSLSIDVARWYDPGRRAAPGELGNLYADLALRMVAA